MSDTTYNGWTNYATWRVNLEVFDGFHAYDDMGADDETDAYSFGEVLKEYAEDAVHQSSEAGLARDYALAFLSDVNWQEIAEHMLDDCRVE